MLAENLIPTDDPLVRRRHRKLYTGRVCAHCGENTWIRKGYRFCSRFCAMAHRSGKNHPRWAGNAAGYEAQHDRVRKARGKADRCLHRNAVGCSSTTFDWAWIHGEDPLDVYSYVSLCRACHAVYDHAGIPKPSIQGTKNHRAKLNDAIVLECRKRNAAGDSQCALAREFGVSQPSMRYAILGKTWKHVPVPPGEALALWRRTPTPETDIQQEVICYDDIGVPNAS